MQSAPNTKVPPSHTSSSQFGIADQYQFVMLDDGRHFIGVDGTDSTSLLVEDTTTGSSFKFGSRSKSINTITFDKDSSTLLVSHEDQHVTQYNLDIPKKQLIKVKEYPNLGIGRITCCFRFLHLAFFGGDESEVIVLDLSRKEVLKEKIKTATTCIFSIEVCLVDKSRIILAAIGCKSNYILNKSDLLDITEFFKGVELPSRLFDDAIITSVSKCGTYQTQKLEIENLKKQLTESTKKTGRKV